MYCQLASLPRSRLRCYGSVGRNSPLDIAVRHSCHGCFAHNTVIRLLNGATDARTFSPRVDGTATTSRLLRSLIFYAEFRRPISLAERVRARAHPPGAQSHFKV